MKENSPVETKIFDVMTLKQYDENLAAGKYGAHQIGIKCEIDLNVTEDLVDELKKAVLYKNTRRSTPIMVKDFKKEGNLLTFFFVCPLPPEFHAVYSNIKSPEKKIGTTFVDFCWLAGEGTTSKTVIEVSTKFNDKHVVGDLSYVLPSKFADDLIEAMHSLNVEFIEGILGDAIVYGPYLFQNGCEII